MDKWMDQRRRSGIQSSGSGNWKQVSQKPPRKPAQSEAMEAVVEKTEKKEVLVAEADMTVVIPVPHATVKPAQPAECGYCITPGMSYTPMQKWNATYEPEVGLERGTIFPELDLPFLGEGGKK